MNNFLTNYCKQIQHEINKSYNEIKVGEKAVIANEETDNRGDYHDYRDCQSNPVQNIVIHDLGIKLQKPCLLN